MKKALLAACLCLSSCSALGFGGALEQPSASFVRASRTAHGVVGQKFKAYVAADSSLTPTVAAQLEALVDDWELAIQNAEEAIAPTPISLED